MCGSVQYLKVSKNAKHCITYYVMIQYTHDTQMAHYYAWLRNYDMYVLIF